MTLPLAATQIEDYRRALSVLFSGFDVYAQGEEAAMKAETYRMAFDGLPAWCVEDAVKRFVQGHVDRPKSQQNRLPVPSEVATEARRIRDAERARQRAQIARQAKARKEQEPEISPEERERVKRRFAELTKHLAEQCAASRLEDRKAIVEFNKPDQPTQFGPEERWWPRSQWPPEEDDSEDGKVYGPKEKE